MKSVAFESILCAVIAALASSECSAEILLAQTRTTASVYGGASYNVDFNGAAVGGQTFTFTTTAPNTRVVIAFNAECAVDGDGTKWVDIDLLVDPAGPATESAASPSNGDNAFCSGNETPSDFVFGNGDGWVSAITQATVVLPAAGDHTVRVLVKGANSGIARLDDMSLIVWR
ncbi:MAG: hypothetical protein U1E83_10235 [Methylotetracoccus sp.]